MIKITNVEVEGWRAAIRGMRNPMNSWDRSDSFLDKDLQYSIADVGESDLALMRRLVKAGSDHSKFMRMITVSMDIEAPLYWWKEYDTYKVGTVANSCSTMHKIHERRLTLNDFSHEHLDQTSLEVLGKLIRWLNGCRYSFVTKQDKADWWQMIQLLPSSYNQKRTVLVNYAVLQKMYHARKNHKLDEWRVFCQHVEVLPYAKELIVGKSDDEEA